MTISLSVLDRGPGIEDPGPVDGAGTARPDPEVPERARRRTFTAKYKLAILAAYEAAADGEKGALLPSASGSKAWSEASSPKQRLR
jgi:hypothetical protein